MSSLEQKIHDIYDRQRPCIHPHIGTTFLDGKDSDLRIMAVGINAYVGARDQGKESPAWFADWFRKQMYRYQKGVWRDLKALAAGLAHAPFRLAAKRFAGMESIFLTNAVKVYVSEAVGKRADQLSGLDYGRHLDQWHDELDVMAEHGVLPHIIAIVGEPFWPFACKSFQTDGAFKRFRTASYKWCKGSCRHFLNGIVLDGPSGKHELLLLRLRHPAGRAPTGSPKWLLDQPEFRAMTS
jgi:hypothetical protein